MKPEIEATFLNIDKNALREKLKSLGAELIQPEILMRRHVFRMDEHSFVRVRDEGYRIVITYKHYDELSLSGAKEINLTIDDYDGAVAFLKLLGLEVKSEQESLRETWKLEHAEIDIDTWPWLSSYVEIEGETEDAVKDAATKLGFDMNNAVYGSVDEVYVRTFDVTHDDVNDKWTEIKFIGDPLGENPAPDWLEAKRRK